MNDAICMLIFGDESYLIGACLSAFSYKLFINKLNLSTKIIAMVDNTIYKYKNNLLQFFDKIYLIKLLKIKLNYNKLYDPNLKNNKYNLNRYSKWIKYSINKWQILNLVEYEKILFVDVDLLPISAKFFLVLNFKTPCIFISENNYKKDDIIQKNIISNKIIFSNNDYENGSLNLKKSINATILLIKPDKKLFDEYINFIKICEGENGYYSTQPDETSFLQFLMFYKNIIIYAIPEKFAFSIKTTELSKNIYGVNYDSIVKPWIKLPMLQWPEENIWHSIAKKVFIKDKVLTNIYVNLLLKDLIYFSNNYKSIKKGYNLECIKNKNIFPFSLELFQQLKNTNNLNYEDINKIFKKAEFIHKMMNKKSLINFTELKNLL